jgi:biopolymer transport protein ExbD
MTPMIDVVFQLIIFFIVTINLAENTNPDIVLADAKNGPLIKDTKHNNTIVVEVDRKGVISIHNIRLSPVQFKQIIQSRYNRMGEFPLLIRGDYRTEHALIRRVMDTCTEIGLFRIQFAAIKEPKKAKRGT